MTSGRQLLEGDASLEDDSETPGFNVPVRYDHNTLAQSGLSHQRTKVDPSVL